MARVQTLDYKRNLTSSLSRSSSTIESIAFIVTHRIRETQCFPGIWIRNTIRRKHTFQRLDVQERDSWFARTIQSCTHKFRPIESFTAYDLKKKKKKKKRKEKSIWQILLPDRNYPWTITIVWMRSRTKEVFRSCICPKDKWRPRSKREEKHLWSRNWHFGS